MSASETKLKFVLASVGIEIISCKKIQMLLGAQNHCGANGAAAAAAANIAASKGATDFSIAAIMSRNSLSREPSERSLSK